MAPGEEKSVAEAVGRAIFFFRTLRSFIYIYILEQDEGEVEEKIIGVKGELKSVNSLVD